MKLTIDFETRSCINLKDCGAWVYSEDPTTDVMCLALKVDEDPGRIWVNPKLAFAAAHHLEVESNAGWGLSDELPLITLDEITDLIQKAEQIEAHNAEFERAMWQNCFSRKYGVPMLPLDKLRCSLAKASYHSLPRGLGELCKVLGVEVQKDDVGAAIMRKMCRPKKLVRAEWKPFEDQYAIPWKDLKEMQASLYETIAYGWHHAEDWEWRNVMDADALIHWHEDPDDILALCRYCLQDVEAEHAASKALADLPARELRVWQMDQEINARGLNTDTELAHKMVAMVERHTADLLDDLATITNGEVQSPRQTAKFKAHVNKSLPDDLQLADVKASSVLAALKDPRVQGEARRLLEIRRSLALSSVAKYEAILNRASMDGRVRGSILYHGAGTGRFSGRGIQPHNFPRGKFKDPEPAIEMVLMDDVEGVKAYWGDPMAVASTCLRGVLTPGEGKEFTCADYSNIEGRGVAWLAGEEWKVESFRAYDKGEGEDNYKLAYSRAFNIPVESVTSDNRQIGKVMELACLAGDTPVLTDTGWKPLVLITKTDRVWDGVEFVAHGGIAGRGVKECVRLLGIEVTPDHLFLTGDVWVTEDKWATAEDLKEEPRLLQSALDTASLSSLPSCAEKWADAEAFSAGVLVAGKLWWPSRIFEKERLPGVQLADEQRQQKPGPGTGTFHQGFEDASMAESPVSTGDALTKTTGSFRSTGGGVSPCSNHGLKTDMRSSDTSPLSLGAPTHSLPSTESTTTKGMNREICASCPSNVSNTTERTPTGLNTKDDECLEPSSGNNIAPGTPGSEPSFERYGKGVPQRRSSKSRPDARARMVYDLVNCGPRNRFMVLTEQGPLIVHNCGYQGGVGAFQSMAAVYGVKVPDDQADELVKLWRRAHPMVVALWYSLEEAALMAVAHPGKAYSYRSIAYKLSQDGRFLLCRLPSGRLLHYPFPALEEAEMPWGETKRVVTYMATDSQTGKFVKSKGYGGLFTENCVQALSRDVMVEGMFRVEEHGYPVVLTVHDEVLSEHPVGHGSVEEFGHLLSVVPSWADGLPVAAAGWRGTRYRKG